MFLVLAVNLDILFLLFVFSPLSEMLVDWVDFYTHKFDLLHWFQNRFLPVDYKTQMLYLSDPLKAFRSSKESFLYLCDARFQLGFLIVLWKFVWQDPSQIIGTEILISSLTSGTECISSSFSVKEHNMNMDPLDRACTVISLWKQISDSAIFHSEVVVWYKCI